MAGQQLHDETSHPRLTAWLKTLQKAWPKDWKLGESARAVFLAPGWDTENWGIKSLVLTVVTEYTSLTYHSHISEVFGALSMV